MLQGEHSVILLTFIKLLIFIKIFVLSIFEWPFYTGFTVNYFKNLACFLFIWYDYLFTVYADLIIQIELVLVYCSD